MTNPFAFTDSFKQLFDINQLINLQRRNVEAGTTAMQCLFEGAQAASRRNAETLRENAEAVLKGSREAFSSGTPEGSLARQAEVTKSLFENTVVNLREVSEMLTKSSFEAFDVLNKRAAESIEEVNQTASSATGSSRKRK